MRSFRLTVTFLSLNWGYTHESEPRISCYNITYSGRMLTHNKTPYLNPIKRSGVLKGNVA